MKRLLIACFATFAMYAATTTNDTSCDISVTPAATLLLPYFEVDLAGAGGETTIVTITNTAALPQAVQVTLWTDYDVPVIAFNLYLTGYDVQSVNLFDVIADGRIPAGGYDVSHHGPLSGGDNPLLREGTCNNLPSVIPAPALARMRSAFTTGKLDACSTAGGVHTNAVGYATIDVVGACSPRLPNDSTYYRDLIRFNNVLIGDSLQFNGRESHAQGNPLVHIRAIPEGGTATSREGKPAFTINSSARSTAASSTRSRRSSMPGSRCRPCSRRAGSTARSTKSGANVPCRRGPRAARCPIARPPPPGKSCCSTKRKTPS